MGRCSLCDKDGEDGGGSVVSSMTLLPMLPFIVLLLMVTVIFSATFSVMLSVVLSVVCVLVKEETTSANSSNSGT